ncbi:MAG: hypothetical protein ACWGNI_07250 [Desulfobacterales bacterium]
METIFPKITKDIQSRWYFMFGVYLCIVAGSYMIVYKEAILQGWPPRTFNAGFLNIFIFSALLFGAASSNRLYRYFSSPEHIQKRLNDTKYSLKKDIMWSKITVDQQAYDSIDNLNDKEKKLLYMPFIVLRAFFYGMSTNLVLISTGLLIASYIYHSYLLTTIFAVAGIFFSFPVFPSEEKMRMVAEFINNKGE